MKSYQELIRLPTYEERFDYLKQSAKIGEDTFGAERYLNQIFYSSDFWKHFRREMIKRDDGFDMGLEGYPIYGTIVLHHINPITIEDIRDRSERLLDPDNVICVADRTHKAIHYGAFELIAKEIIERRPNDTCPWKK